MKKIFATAVILTGLSSPLMADGMSDGTLELCVNALRTDANSLTSVFSAVASGDANVVNFVSSPIRIGYEVNDQFTVFGGAPLFSSNSVDPDAGNESMVSGRSFTAGVIANLNTGLLVEGTATRLTLTIDNGTEETDHVGNHFEKLVGRRFAFSNDLYVEPKAGVSFSSEPGASDAGLNEVISPDRLYYAEDNLKGYLSAQNRQVQNWGLESPVREG